MENSGDKKKREREGKNHVLSWKSIRPGRKTMCWSDPGEEEGCTEWPPEALFSTNDPWRRFTDPQELTPTQPWLAAFPPLWPIFSLHSLWQFLPNPSCPRSFAAGNYPWPMAWRQWLAPWRWDVPNLSIKATAGQHTMRTKPSLFYGQASHMKLDFPLFADLASFTVVTPGLQEAHICYKVFWETHTALKWTIIQISYFIFFSSMGIGVLLCQRTYFRIFFWLLPGGKVQGPGDFLFFNYASGESWTICGLKKRRRKGNMHREPNWPVSSSELGFKGKFKSINIMVRVAGSERR